MKARSISRSSVALSRQSGISSIKGKVGWSRLSARQANKRLLPAVNLLHVNGTGRFIVLERPDVSAKASNDATRPVRPPKIAA